MIFRSRTACFCVAAVLAALFTAAAAQAQLSPFGSKRRVQGLTKTDTQLLLAAVEQLNAKDDLRAGDAQAWQNTKSGNSGNVTTTKLLTKSGLACHAMHYDITIKSAVQPSAYDFTWCRTPAGDWKISN